MQQSSRPGGNDGHGAHPCDQRHRTDVEAACREEEELCKPTPMCCLSHTRAARPAAPPAPAASAAALQHRHQCAGSACVVHAARPAPRASRTCDRAERLGNHHVLLHRVALLQRWIPLSGPAAARHCPEYSEHQAFLAHSSIGLPSVCAPSPVPSDTGAGQACPGDFRPLRQCADAPASRSTALACARGYPGRTCTPRQRAHNGSDALHVGMGRGNGSTAV